MSEITGSPTGDGVLAVGQAAIPDGMHITNQRQYWSSDAKRRGFLAAAERLRLAPLEAGEELNLRALQVEALLAQAQQLAAQLAAYDQLRAGPATLEATSAAGLGQILIHARIARRWTQRQLADQLGVKEQQVQRYEATRYGTVTLSRIQQVADALHLDITSTGHLRGPRHREPASPPAMGLPS